MGLSALSATSVAALVRAELGSAASTEFCSGCWELAGGNPLFVRELLAAAHNEGLSGAQDSVTELRALASSAVGASVDPGLLPIGLGEAALSSTAHRQTPAGRVYGWIRDQFDAGRGADPEQAIRLILALASGKADRLSGRHLSVSENLETLLARIDEIERDDLHTLRLRTSI